MYLPGTAQFNFGDFSVNSVVLRLSLTVKSTAHNVGRRLAPAAKSVTKLYIV